MASSYPTTLDSFSTAHVNGETIVHGTDNDQADAINKIEAELGTLPKGTYATVRAKLDALLAVQKAGSAVATRQTLNFIDGAGISSTVVDNSGSARIDVTLTSTGAQVITNSQAGTTYTLVVTDADKVIEFTSSSAVTLTVPTNASVAFPVGTVIEVFRYGTGEVSVAGAGITFRSPGGGLRLNNQYSAAVLRKRATDEWVFQGDIKV